MSTIFIVAHQLIKNKQLFKRTLRYFSILCFLLAKKKLFFTLFFQQTSFELKSQSKRRHVYHHTYQISFIEIQSIATRYFSIRIEQNDLMFQTTSRFQRLLQLFVQFVTTIIICNLYAYVVEHKLLTILLKIKSLIFF